MFHGRCILAKKRSTEQTEKPPFCKYRTGDCGWAEPGEQGSLMKRRGDPCKESLTPKN